MDIVLLAIRHGETEHVAGQGIDALDHNGYALFVVLPDSEHLTACILEGLLRYAVGRAILFTTPDVGGTPPDDPDWCCAPLVIMPAYCAMHQRRKLRSASLGHVETFCPTIQFLLNCQEGFAVNDGFMMLIFF